MIEKKYRAEEMGMEVMTTRYLACAVEKIVMSTLIGSMVEEQGRVAWISASPLYGVSLWS